MIRKYPSTFDSEADPWRRIVLENALDAVVGMDEEQNILEWNRQAEVIFGWKREEALGRQLAEVIIPPAYRQAHQAGMKHYLATGEGPVLNIRIEVEGLHRSGRIFPIELTVIPLHVEGKRVFYSFLRDISDRKQVEQVLSQSEQLFRTLAESIPQFTWMAEADGFPSWHNQRWYDYTGTTPDSMKGEGWSKVSHPAHAARVTESFWNAIKKGESWEEVFPLRGKHGEWRWFLSRAVPVKSADGKVIRWFGTSTDVTSQRRTREQIEFLSKASTILSSSLDYNETLQRVAQVSVPELGDWCSITVVEDNVPNSIAIAHPDPQMARIADEFRTKYPTDWTADSMSARVLRTGKSELQPWVTDEMLVAAAAKDAEYLRLVRALQIRSVMVVPIHGRTQVLGVLTLVSTGEHHKYDENDLKIAEELGRRAGLAIDNSRLFMQAQEAIRMRDEFLSIASHELKTPLTSLTLQAQLARRQYHKDEHGFFEKKSVDKLLDSTTKQVERLSVLIDDMLDISRITHGKLTLQPESVDMGLLVQDVVERFQEQLAVAHCKCDLKVMGRVEGFWDRHRIEQVVTNLLTNAMKYGGGKPIHVKVYSENGRAFIVVQDEGMGIDPANQERIFQRFERAILATNISGLGLGLYISRQIVEVHGGKISVESSLGKGSAFKVELPLRSERKA